MTAAICIPLSLLLVIAVFWSWCSDYLDWMEDEE